MAKKVTDPKKPKKRKVKRKLGPGFKGSAPMASQAELNVLQRGLSQKQDVSSETLYDKALTIEQAKIGEKKTSYTQRIKGDYTGMDFSTGKRTKSKSAKAKTKQQKKAVTAYHKKHGTSRKLKRAIKGGKR